MPESYGEAPVRPITVAEITDEMWQEVTRNHLAAPPLAKSRSRTRSPAAGAAGTSQPPVALPLQGLLGLEGDAFVQGAYATLLARAADEAGTAYMTAQLSGGRSKIDLLGELQRSTEARQSGRSIAGLGRRYLAHRFYRIPVLGPAARLAAAVLRHAGISRRLGGRGQSRVAVQAELATQVNGLAFETNSRHRALQEQVATQQMSIDLLTRRLAMMQAGQEAAARKLAEDRHRLWEQAARLGHAIAAPEAGLADILSALLEEADGQRGRLAKVEGAAGATVAEAQIEATAGALRAELDRHMIAAKAIAAQTRQDMADQQHWLRQALARLDPDTAVPAAPLPPLAPDDRGLDSLYVALLDRFRGSRAEIKRRLRLYLPRLRGAEAGLAQRPILDLGAGRGEFLELMAEEGLVAHGVDSNAAMTAICRQLGLDCAECDGVAYLAACPAGSLGAVTGFHIIEHLQFPLVVRLLDEARRALAPGGLLILESPNPANLLTASRYFYLDPTHRNPLPAELMAMVAEARGFSNPEIIELHPRSARLPGDGPLVEALDQLFHGPQDYALVARKA